MPQLVMIVDDDQMNRELLETVVKRAGYTVSHANSAHWPRSWGGLNTPINARPSGIGARNIRV